MRVPASLSRNLSRGAWLLLWCWGIILASGSHTAAGTEEDLRQKIATGEIVVSATADPKTSVKRGEMIGVVDAPPEIVWQVITDVNNFKHFMPCTLNSMAVPADKVPLIVTSRLDRAEQVERLLGPTPADPATYRIPGGKYTGYLYSNLEFPWPCSNRWYIIKGQYDETRAAQQRYRNSWSLVTGNLEENSGEWTLEPFGANRTKVVYKLCTDPGGAIPGGLVQQGTSTTMPRIIAAVRERAKQVMGGKPPK